jgi:hypothetical protein
VDSRAIAIAVAMLASTAPARAGGPAVAAPGGPDDIVGRDVVLAREAGEAAATIELNFSRRRVYDPVSVAPDLWFGVTDRITVGLIHSSRATGVIDAGNGLCSTGSAHGCPAAYDNIGLDGRYALRRGWLAIAGRVRLVASSFDPFKPSVRPGALIRLHRGRFGVIADPQLQLGLARRDEGNRDWLRIPLWAAIQPVRGLAVALRTGIDGELATFADTYAVPIGFDLTLRVTRRVELSVFFGFPTLLGPQNQFTRRVVWLGVGGRWP